MNEPVKPVAIAHAPRQEHTAHAPGFDDATYSNDGATAVPAPPSTTSVATLLTRHILRDGEIVLLVLKPSRWFVIQSGIVAATVVAIILSVLDAAEVHHLRFYFDGGLFCVSAAIMWAVLHWMGRLYVLTDQRLLRLSGVFTIEVYDCPLRKVGRTRVVRSIREKLLRLGSIEIYPCDETRNGSAWQTIRQPMEVNEQIQAAIRKAKQGG